MARTIVFAGYTTAGYDVFSMPYPAVGGVGVGVDAERVDLQRTPVAPERVAPVDPERGDLQGAASYNPLATLAPTSWTPIVENDGVTFRLGGLVSGTDVLGYHAYPRGRSWLVSTTTDAPVPSRALPDWQVYYEYDRWRPRSTPLDRSRRRLPSVRPRRRAPRPIRRFARRAWKAASSTRSSTRARATSARHRSCAHTAISRCPTAR